MKSFIHINTILAIGVILGLTIRSIRSGSNPNQPPADEIVYTNDSVIDGLSEDEIASIENPEVSHPPDGADWLSQF